MEYYYFIYIIIYFILLCRTGVFQVHALFSIVGFGTNIKCVKSSLIYMGAILIIQCNIIDNAVCLNVTILGYFWRKTFGFIWKIYMYLYIEASIFGGEVLLYYLLFICI